MWYLKAEWHSINPSELIFFNGFIFLIAFAMEKTDAILDWKMRLSSVPSSWAWAVQTEGLGASGMLAVKGWHAATSFYNLQNSTCSSICSQFTKNGKTSLLFQEHISAKP